MNKNVNVSCVQMQPALADPETNLKRMQEFVEEIATARPETDLIVFPELINSGYECTKEEFAAFAEELKVGAGIDDVPAGSSIAVMGALCRLYDLYIIYGLPEKDGAVMYNSAVCLDPDGKIVKVYRKAHPFADERKWCEAGTDLTVFDTRFGKVGLMICWDTAFPEVARAYALQEADLLVVATNWESPYSADWDLFTKARALDNTLHLVSANRIGFDKTLGFFGHSNIINPVGQVIESLDEEVEGIIHAELDLSQTAKLREEYYTFFTDRQPEIYRELVSAKRFG
jgi:predicted amidohydrolase